MSRQEYLQWVCDRLFELVKEETGRRVRITGQCAVTFLLVPASVGFVAGMAKNARTTPALADLWTLTLLSGVLAFLLFLSTLWVRGIASVDTVTFVDCDYTNRHDDFEFRLTRVRNHLMEVVRTTREQSSQLASRRKPLIAMVVITHLWLGMLVIGYLGQ